MSEALKNKVDFALIIAVNNANPNGDPLNGNRPRQTYDGFGEISDVCLKRKLRNRLQDMGERIFVQSDDRRDDEHRSLNARYAAEKLKDPRVEGCAKWYDVRAFGQLFAFKKKKTKKEEEDGGDADAVSIGIRGPVSIQSAFSVEPVIPETIQIVKSVNLETNEKEPDKKGSDTMGMKHRVGRAVYVAYGAINTQLAKETGFSAQDAEKLKKAMRSLFVNDESTARPAGSMEVLKIIWWQHNHPNGQYSSAQVHRSLKVAKDGSYELTTLKGLKAEELSELSGTELD
ncbi:MAG TPA: type I-C CRISPR-associated protein Cas7/Csd2 [Kiritimatiellia bacterium]|jgi:CRISPR-associated protein Csd2|nr:type I-C CRISPR-associated protein Cas7/Csd2 [Kiritimatiellia bacterium]HOE36992.1 type I-C CRISPR-associated protein Cas7/Csd2 [Kiritimatiellia bacterium]HOR74325.1 type I-C CRISPR-associated protein Cas7/Csd2 [Kiritimatiellia bacterium]HOU59914.1 type I-C CRISPR-associated protein Cas7/Csd2 [Kiritimatiellia bacterium]HPK69576.1 type I-C CRISPR-associated protein Cas7/Csd2 [Kiritimatiellia bacterium]